MKGVKEVLADLCNFLYPKGKEDGEWTWGEIIFVLGTLTFVIIMVAIGFS